MCEENSKLRARERTTEGVVEKKGEDDEIMEPRKERWHGGRKMV